MLRYFQILLITCVSLLAAAFPHSFALGEVSEKSPNVIVILADDLGWTDLGCYGSDLYETPHIDRLAEDGLRFTNAYAACTVCSPTRAALLTGKYPARLHLTDWIHGHHRKNALLEVPDWTHHLPREEVTLAEAFGEAGYATCHIGKWHLGGEGRLPTDQGFDRNLGGTHRGQPPSYFSPYRIATLPDGPKGEYLTDREAAEACRFIADHRNRPFFLYLAHHAVHTPLQGKREVAARYRKKIESGMKHRHAVYAAMIESVDDSLGRIRAQLERSGLAGRTLIVFTSDNGGLTVGAAPTNNAPLRAGKGSAYEGGVRVPFIVYRPGMTSSGKTCDEPVISNDIFPTVLAAAGVNGNAKQGRAMDGTNLLPLLEDPAAHLSRDAIHWHYPHYHPGGATPYSAIRAGDWKLIEFFEDDHVELYDLVHDIGETTDLSSKRPEKTAELRARLRAWRKSVNAQLPTPASKSERSGSDGR